MVEIQIEYRGGLRCKAVHTPSSRELITDAPLDNQGQGASFSPTDLLATALGTCMLTIMGIVAERNGWSLEGARVKVLKEMVADPRRRVGTLTVELSMPGELDAEARKTLEQAALTCPVRLSLEPAMQVPVAFVWDSAVRG